MPEPWFTRMKAACKQCAQDLDKAKIPVRKNGIWVHEIEGQPDIPCDGHPYLNPPNEVKA